MISNLGDLNQPVRHYDNEWWCLLERQICIGLFVMTALSLSWPLIKRMLPKKQKD